MSVLEILSKLRGARKALTAADLEAALGKIDTAALRERVLAAEVGRREALLAGRPEAEVAALEADLQRARNEAERAEIAAADLAVRAAEAREQEAAVALDRDVAAVRAEAQATGKRLAEEYEAAASAIAAALAAADAAEARVADLNVRLRAAGRHDLVAGPLERAFPPLGAHVSRPDVHASISLPPAGSFAGLGEALERYRLLGIAPMEAAE